MTSIHHQLVRLLVGAMVIVAGTRAVALAQDDAELEERVELKRAADVQKFSAEQTRQRLQAAYSAQFDRWVTAQFRTRDGARQQLEELLAQQIRKLTADCHLTANQQGKLYLAGRGDIKHFLDRFDFIARTMEYRDSSIDDLRAAMRELSPLANSARARLFGEYSLLGKTLTGVLDSQQAAAREKALVAKNKEWHRAAIDSSVNTLRTNLGLSNEQATRLSQLLLKDTRPPRRFGIAPDIALVLFQASRISEDKIRPIFDDGQWRIMYRWMAVYFQGASGEKTLVKFGFVFDDGPAAGQSAGVGPMAEKNDPRGERTDRPRLIGGVP